MQSTVKKNLLKLMASSEGRDVVVNLVTTLLAITQDEPEASATTTSCSCEICQENLDDSAKMLNEVRASVQAENP